jgi:ribonuclease HI
LQKITIIFTDGACSGNPGPGGWAAVIERQGKCLELSGSEKSTTNNRMEMLAAIRGLEKCEAGELIQLHSDSKYVVNGITEWLPGWKKKNWKTSDGKPVKNQDLWQKLDQLNTTLKIDWRWVRGHNGNAGNERADLLAVSQIKNSGYTIHV